MDASEFVSLTSITQPVQLTESYVRTLDALGYAIALRWKDGQITMLALHRESPTPLIDLFKKADETS